MSIILLFRRKREDQRNIFQFYFYMPDYARPNGCDKFGEFDFNNEIILIEFPSIQRIQSYFRTIIRTIDLR